MVIEKDGLLVADFDPRYCLRHSATLDVVEGSDHRPDHAARALELTGCHTTYNCRMNSTRLCFSSAVSFSSRTRLKNSTVSSSVKSRPSWKYGGLSLIPRSVNALIGPSPASFFRNRSTWRSCIWLSR